MTITLEVAPEMVQELEDEAARRGLTLEELAKQSLMRTLIKGLRDRSVPQTLAEIKPRVQPPPGKTIKEMLSDELWPDDETDEALLAALKAMG